MACEPIYYCGLIILFTMSGKLFSISGVVLVILGALVLILGYFLPQMPLSGMRDMDDLEKLRLSKQFLNSGIILIVVGLTSGTIVNAIRKFKYR